MKAKRKQKPEKSFTLNELAKPFKTGMKRQHGTGSLELAVALDAISRLPLPKTSLKESLAVTENKDTRVALACLESVERLCLSGLTGLHSVRYLRSVLQSAGDGIFPHRLNLYTSPLLEEIHADGETASFHSCRSSGSVSQHSAAKRKKSSR